ncbi:MAG TPA: nucleotidyltransferase substrate binding protein [Thiobacillaceae bacterium]|nr:nucleotidyltransferase substrate binding protein [Thiobacillaceae bacterium]
MNWIADDFATAQSHMETALATPAENDLIKAGCIQYFEFTFELGWKACKRVTAEQGLPDCLSPKVCCAKPLPRAGSMTRRSGWKCSTPVGRWKATNHCRNTAACLENHW